MKINIYGDNLCALTSAAVLASVGNEVSLCLPEGLVKQTLENKQIPFIEPKLGDLVDQQLLSGRLVFSDLQHLSFKSVDIVLLSFGHQDLKLAERITLAIAESAESLLVVNQSTFNVGCSEFLFSLLSAGQYLVYIPDFIQEGTALSGAFKPNNLILGCEDKKAQKLVFELFRPFKLEVDHFLLMTLREAEFTKLAVSGMLATRISFMNDLANVADSIGVDIEKVRIGVGSDPRIGHGYLNPGCGFGGESFSEGVMSLAQTVSGVGIKSKLLEQVLQINEDQKEVLFRKLWQYFNCDLQQKTVAIWGAAYKPNTNKIDNAPSLKLLEALWAQGVTVKLYDPKALVKIQQRYGNHPQLILCEEAYQATVNADALLILTEWKEFFSPNFFKIKQNMRHLLIVDGRNIYDPLVIKSKGFDYIGVGRK